jgi:hypothetical protein
MNTHILFLDLPEKKVISVHKFIMLKLKIKWNITKITYAVIVIGMLLQNKRKR